MRNLANSICFPITSIHGLASSTCAAGTGFECGSVISSGPKGAGTLGSSDRILWSGDLVKTKIVTVSTYNDDSYNENIYNKSYSREFISQYVSISFLYSLNYILSIYCLCSENCQLNQKISHTWYNFCFFSSTVLL